MKYLQKPCPRDYDCEADYNEAVNEYLDYKEYVHDQMVDDAWEAGKEERMERRRDRDV